MFDVDNGELFDVVIKFMNQKEVLSFDEYLKFINGLNLNEFYVSDVWRQLAMEIEDDAFDKFRDLDMPDNKELDDYEYKLHTMIEFNGGEGQGDSADIVMKHIPSGRFVSLDGSYSSYEGFFWEYGEWVEVFPVDVVRTEYVAEKPQKPQKPPMPIMPLS